MQASLPAKVNDRAKVNNPGDNQAEDNKDSAANRMISVQGASSLNRVANLKTETSGQNKASKMPKVNGRANRASKASRKAGGRMASDLAGNNRANEAKANNPVKANSPVKGSSPVKASNRVRRVKGSNPARASKAMDAARRTAATAHPAGSRAIHKTKINVAKTGAPASPNSPACRVSKVAFALQETKAVAALGVAASRVNRPVR
jgi:hypothetical protein